MILKNVSDKIEVVPTGLPQFDRLLGVGGYPRKYLTMISGAGGVGKTTIAAQSIREAQRLGLKVLYVETDFKFVPSYLKSLGVDLSKLTIIQGEVGEEVLAEMLEELKDGEYQFVVVDTVSKITPLIEAQKANFDSQTIGQQAKLISRFLRKLKPLANQHNMAVVLLNHERIDIMTSAVKTPGGEAIQEDVVVWVRMSHTGDYLVREGKKVGKKIKARIWRKNQVSATEGQEEILNVIFGAGFDVDADLLAQLLFKGILTKDGSHFYFRGEKICYGEPKARAWIAERADELREALNGG